MPADHPSLIAAQDQLEAARRVLGDIVEHETLLRSAGAWICGRGLANLEQYLANLRGSAPLPEHDEAVELPELAGTTVADAVAAQRELIKQARADAHETRSAPIPPAEAKAIARQQIVELAQRGAPFCLHTQEAGHPVR